jgi:hypothetical protein
VGREPLGDFNVAKLSIAESPSDDHVRWGSVVIAMNNFLPSTDQPRFASSSVTSMIPAPSKKVGGIWVVNTG